jgi:hypothetical protein
MGKSSILSHKSKKVSLGLINSDLIFNIGIILLILLGIENHPNIIEN